MSDRELDERIRHCKRLLIDPRRGQWQKEQVRKELDRLQRQRSLPLSERLQYREGTL